VYTFADDDVVEEWTSPMFSGESYLLFTEPAITARCVKCDWLINELHRRNHLFICCAGSAVVSALYCHREVLLEVREGWWRTPAFTSRTLRATDSEHVKQNRKCGSRIFFYCITVTCPCCRINGFYNDVELKFKVTNGDGQLLWISDEPNIEFLSVGLKDGFVRLGYSVGSGDLWMTWSRYRVDDSAWHVVNLKRFVRLRLRHVFI